jgi:excisionase family DNA binding protein
MSTDFLTVEQIAKELSLSEETILRWIRKKDLKAYKLGKTYRILKKDYQEFLNQRYTGNSTQEESNG